MVIQIKIVATFGEVLSKKRHTETSGLLNIFCISISVLTTQKYAKIPPAGHLKFVNFTKYKLYINEK